MHTNLIHGYHKICYSKYPYANKLGYQIPAERIIQQASCPKKMKSVDYTISCNNDQKGCVTLTARDKRRIAEYLKNYNDDTPITDAMIQELLKQGLRKQMIGWVLEDFKYHHAFHNKPIFVSHIRSQLNLW